MKFKPLAYILTTLTCLTAASAVSAAETCRFIKFRDQEVKNDFWAASAGKITYTVWVCSDPVTKKTRMRKFDDGSYFSLNSRGGNQAWEAGRVTGSGSYTYVTSNGGSDAIITVTVSFKHKFSATFGGWADYSFGDWNAPVSVRVTPWSQCASNVARRNTTPWRSCVGLQ